MVKEIIGVDRPENMQLKTKTKQVIESCFEKYSDLEEMRTKGKLRVYQDILKIKNYIKSLFD